MKPLWRCGEVSAARVPGRNWWQSAAPTHWELAMNLLSISRRRVTGTAGDAVALVRAAMLAATALASAAFGGAAAAPGEAASAPSAAVAPGTDQAPAAAGSAPQARTIYQQRRPDGSIVLSDRPATGMKTERQWAVEPEDPATANARRDASRAESERVTERIQRSLDQQAERNAALEAQRLKAQQAADERKAREERQASNEPTTIVVVPNRPNWPYPARPLPAPVPKPVKPVPLPEPMLNVKP
jgi:hypothetical protein